MKAKTRIGPTSCSTWKGSIIPEERGTLAVEVISFSIGNPFQEQFAAGPYSTSLMRWEESFRQKQPSPALCPKHIPYTDAMRNTLLEHEAGRDCVYGNFVHILRVALGSIANPKIPPTKQGGEIRTRWLRQTLAASENRNYTRFLFPLIFLPPLCFGFLNLPPLSSNFFHFGFGVRSRLSPTPTSTLRLPNCRPVNAMATSDA